MASISSFAILAFSIAATVAAGHSHTTRDIKQLQGRQGANPNGNRDRTDGKVFDFNKFGGAASFLATLDPHKLQKLLDKAGSNNGRGKLAKLLDEDPDFGVDVENGALLYACEGLAAAAAQLGAEITSGASPSELDPNITQAFTLASRPTSAKKIWLDFDGCVITNTAWNYQLPTITIPPYDMDGTSTSFSNAELSDIVSIWRAVSEDYAPFDVDVTTIPPVKVNAAFVTRVCIGGDGAWYGPGVGGVAYVGIFGTNDNSRYSPAFVFPKALNNAKNTWEAISHEVGHNMGLSHDGTATEAYYRGQGDWAPIMGVGYSRHVTQWSKGEYSGANNIEDDIALLANKLALVPAQNGNSLATATLLSGAVSTVDNLAVATATATGIVGQAGVPDVFKFYAAAGQATITVQVLGDYAGRQRSNLDMLIRLLTSTGDTLATIDPPSTLTANGLGVAAVNIDLPADGWYYVTVIGTGSGNPADTGYSDYASLGQFSIAVVYHTNNDPSLVAPSPSPSPRPPAQPTMTATATITSSASKSQQLTCTAQVKVLRAGDNAPVSGATVYITWSTFNNMLNFPYSTTASTGSSGVTTSVSKKISNGKGCRFEVTGVTAPGYAQLTPSIVQQLPL